MHKLHRLIEKRVFKKEQNFLKKLKKSSHFSEKEKQHIQQHLHDNGIREIIHIFFVFLALTGIFSLLDFVFLAISAVYSYLQDSANFWLFFIFLIASGGFKVWYAHLTLKNFTWFDKLLSTLPYVGASLLLVKGLQNAPLTKRALWLFLKKQL